MDETHRRYEAVLEASERVSWRVLDCGGTSGGSGSSNPSNAGSNGSSCQGGSPGGGGGHGRRRVSAAGTCNNC